MESDFASALDDGCEQFIPEIAIESVVFETSLDGKVAAKIFVEGRDED